MTNLLKEALPVAILAGVVLAVGWLVTLLALQAGEWVQAQQSAEAEAEAFWEHPAPTEVGVYYLRRPGMDWQCARVLERDLPIRTASSFTWGPRVAEPPELMGDR